uniref:RING finger protein 207 isoform X3 n=1 Tax=Callospermophilus lateralis TaxID=76772 RepID=UPI004038D1E0
MSFQAGSRRTSDRGRSRSFPACASSPLLQAEWPRGRAADPPARFRLLLRRRQHHPGGDVRSYLHAPRGPRRPGHRERPPSRVPSVPRAVRAPVPAGMLPRLLCWLPSWSGCGRPPGLPAVSVSAPNHPRRERLALPGGESQDAETTYFCNTCEQPLCARCRDETHRARMFARHDIVALGQRSRDVIQKCTLHGEPYIMFSTDKKSLLCIRCFRDMQGESRAHCVDLESAYVQGCERLEQAVLAVKALQTATREAIALLQVMVEEVRRSAAEEDAAIHTLFGSMQDKLAERKALLLQAVQSQYDEKDKAFKEQLSHLAALLPTLQVHLVICSSFLSLANKAEFLDLGYELMERLQSIVTGPHRLRPAQSSKIASDHHAEFARCLEPLLLLGPRRAASAANTLAGGAGPKVLMGPRCPSPVRKTPGSPVQKPTLHRSISTKVLLAEGEDTPFTEHCRHYEDAYRGLQAEVQNLKDQVQELHRDLTRHHSLIKAEIMGDILSRSLRLDARIASEYSSAEGMRAIFQEIWEESYQRVANEQEVYEAQLHDLLQLKQENAYLTTITKQITPYVRSIAKVKERLEPRNDPGSAVEKGEKTSESKGNSRALSGVSEDPPLKNREHLRSKQKNGDDLPTCREQPT